MNNKEKILNILKNSKVYSFNGDNLNLTNYNNPQEQITLNLTALIEQTPNELINQAIEQAKDGE